MNTSSTQTLDSLPEFFSPAIAADLLHISRSSAYRHAANGIIPTFRIGKRMLISKKHFISWIDQKYSEVGYGKTQTW